ncbi:glutamate racemase [uncultured Polaribacter sp.]|uniref:glutamate racemase n=1 Tax=uncultured Polaribacter sp. TaxID=174711 RepID=UPI002624479A|nr:glutamate racemase [uncultured Polaribacter sp.]
MDSSKNAIGFFDSGVGGTSIWKEVTTLLPNENTIYLSDSKNAPYGAKTKEEIIQLCVKNTRFLLEQNCKTIVVACNTATTNAINFLRKNYNIPFIGIEPAIKPASLITKTKKIGILATKGTLNSTLFEKTANSLKNDIIIKETIGTGLVELIENGKLNSLEITTLLHTYLQPMLAENIDALVLGCTHYPYLTNHIRKIVGTKIQIIDSGEAVARQTKAVLNKHNLQNQSKASAKHVLFINKNKGVLEQLISKKHTTIIEREF